MLGVWQIDHVFTGYFWSKGYPPKEILRFFTISVYMKPEDFWILCIFTILLGYFILALGLNISSIKRRIKERKK